MAVLNAATFSGGSSGPTLQHATTKARFSAARTGTCSDASSSAKEFRLFSSSVAPRRATDRGTSGTTPSMQA